MTYITTDKFLKMFGYVSLNDLPDLPRYKLDENQQIVIDDLNTDHKIDIEKQNDIGMYLLYVQNVFRLNLCFLSLKDETICFRFVKDIGHTNTMPCLYKPICMDRHFFYSYPRKKRDNQR